MIDEVQRALFKAADDYANAFDLLKSGRATEVTTYNEKLLHLCRAAIDYSTYALMKDEEE